MSVDGIVLIHGGMHGSWCWDPLVPLLDGSVIAVDLPGRGRRPADLASVTLDDCVAAVLDDADQAGFDRFAVVAHSLGGVTTTELAYRHPERVALAIYVGALVPPPDSTASIVMTGSDIDKMDLMPEELAKRLFGNDLTDEQWASHWKGLVPDAPGIMNARLSGYPSDVPLIYVNMLQDAPVPPALADQMVANLGPGVERHSIDAGHTVMVSNPAALAAIVNDVVSR